MRQLLTRNLGWKLLSLLIAVTLWIAVAREPELASSLSVPLEFKNLPEDLDLVGDVPDRVHLEVRGQSGNFTRDNLAEIGVVLDLAGTRAGERTYAVNASNVNLPFGVSFYRAIPSQITLSFDRLMTREVQIKPVYVKTPESYRVRRESILPAKVRIRGPEELVKNMDRVMTDPVDLSGVVGEREFRTHLKLGDPQVRLDAPSVVTLKVALEKARDPK